MTDRSVCSSSRVGSLPTRMSTTKSMYKVLALAPAPQPLRPTTPWWPKDCASRVDVLRRGPRAPCGPIGGLRRMAFVGRAVRLQRQVGGVWSRRCIPWRQVALRPRWLAAVVSPTTTWTWSNATAARGGCTWPVRVSPTSISCLSPTGCATIATNSAPPWRSRVQRAALRTTQACTPMRGCAPPRCRSPPAPNAVWRTCR